MRTPSTTASNFDSCRVGSRWAPLALLLLSGLSLFFAPAPPVSGAAEFHPFEYEIDGTGTTAGQFSRIEDVAVHQSTGTVYVLDRNHHSIDKFDSAGNPQNFAATGESSLDLYTACPGYEIYQYGGAGIAVDSSGTANDGRIYAAGESGGACAFDSAGEYLWRLHSPDNPEAGGACGATTDPLGRLWLVAGGLLQYTAAGNPPTLVTITEPASTCRAAVGSGGRIYLLNQYANIGAGAVERWSVLGPQLQISSPANGGLGLDPATEHVYAGKGQQIDEFTSEGVKVGDIGIGPPYALTGLGTIGHTAGIAVRGSTGQVFVADNGSETLKVYGKREVFPDLSTGEASSIRRTSVSLGGHLTPVGGDVTACRFEWGPTSSYGNTAPCDQATPIAGPQDVSAGLTGLTPGTTYHFRLVAENANGPNWGADQTFTTPFVNQVQTTAATGITRTGATLNGSLAPGGINAHYYFEWGPDQSYGSSTPVPPGTDAGSGAGATSATTTISGLAFGTTYHYRLVASNVDGTTFGEDASFRTTDAVAETETLPATDLAPQQATLNGALDPDGQATDFYFEWGPTSSYGNATATPPGEPAGAGNGSVTVSATIEGLFAYTTYHYRLVATNAVGTTYGSDEVVTTAPPALPSVSDTAASGVTPTTAVLSAAINPGYGLTIYRFEYGTDTDYGSRTPTPTPLDEDGATHPVQAAVTGLAPGTTYHYQVVATNFSGAVKGRDQAFTTPGPPQIPVVGVSQITKTSARIEATVTPVLTATTYRIEYGGRSTAEIPVGTVDNLPHAVAVDLTGLSPGTRYPVRIVATNAHGTDVGDELVFNTLKDDATTKPPVRCKKGRVRRKGQCVKRGSKRRHHGKHGNRANRQDGAKARG